MGSDTAILGPLLIDWLILFVVCYIVTEFGQDYLYDESTPYLGLKVLLGSLLLAALLTWTRTRFDTMATYLGATPDGRCSRRSSGSLCSR